MFALFVVWWCWRSAISIWWARFSKRYRARCTRLFKKEICFSLKASKSTHIGGEIGGLAKLSFSPPISFFIRNGHKKFFVWLEALFHANHFEIEDENQQLIVTIDWNRIQKKLVSVPPPFETITTSSSYIPSYQSSREPSFAAKHSEIEKHSKRTFIENNNYFISQLNCIRHSLAELQAAQKANFSKQ
jgi:hypothetical protein